MFLLGLAEVLQTHCRHLLGVWSHHCLCCLIPVIVEIAEVAGVGDLTSDLAYTAHTAQHGVARGNASKIHSR